MAANKTPINIKIGTKEEPVRFSYVNVFEPRENQNGKLQYSASLLIPKEYKKQIKAIKAMIAEANDRGLEDLWGGKQPKFKNEVLRDGDEEYPDKPEYEGMMFISAKADLKHQPKVVDSKLAEVMDDDQFASGDYGRASIDFFPYHHKESNQKGISAALGNIQVYSKGERFGGGGRSIAADFGEDEGSDMD